MNVNKLLRRLKFFLQFVPITLNAVIVGAVAILLIVLLQPEKLGEEENPSSYLPFLLLMSKTALWVIATFISFSFLSVLTTWLYYIWLLKRKKHRIQFHFSPNREKGSMTLEAMIPKVRRPFLGFIKTRLIYDDHQLTQIFTLAGNKRGKRHILREGVQTRGQLRLPDIKAYSLLGNFLFFEDMFQLFSFPIYQKQTGNFFQSPQKKTLPTQAVVPRETKAAQIKIEESRRIPGDFLKTKSYESGDDVRRIVWKIYAKSREFMVRIPEERDFYASHIYFYASFFAGVPGVLYESSFGKEMLNYYKNRVWSGFEALFNSESQIRFISDQDIHLDPSENLFHSVQNLISNSQWQDQKDLADYFQKATGAVCCISSFNDPSSIEEMLDACGKDTIIYYVKLSAVFHHSATLSWLSKIFLLPSEDRLKRIRSLWVFHPFKRQLLKRENEIEKILDNSMVSIGRI